MSCTGDTDNTDRTDKTITHVVGDWESGSGWASGWVLLWVQVQESGCHLVLEPELASGLEPDLGLELELAPAQELAQELEPDLVSDSEFDWAAAPLVL